MEQKEGKLIRLIKMDSYKGCSYSYLEDILEKHGYKVLYYKCPKIDINAVLYCRYKGIIIHFLTKESDKTQLLRLYGILNPEKTNNNARFSSKNFLVYKKISKNRVFFEISCYENILNFIETFPYELNLVWDNESIKLLNESIKIDLSHALKKK